MEKTKILKFEIINVFFKERRSKYKPAYALDTQHVLNFSCLYRDFSLVMEIWFKVLEIHWSKYVRTLNAVPERILCRTPLYMKVLLLRRLSAGSPLSTDTGVVFQVIPTKDRLEGLSAFKEKRRPHFKGE